MNNALFKFESPKNEPIQQFAKNSKERSALVEEVKGYHQDKLNPINYWW